ncbi:lysylphosphatidylglycerol synthase transmembrane domain-containing protein [Patescibacteria group bacterium]
MDKYTKVAVKIFVSSVLLGVIFYNVDKESLLSNIKMLDLRYAPLIIALLILNYIVSSVRWKGLLIFENSEQISLKYLTYLYFTGAFFNNFMPTSIGGDVYKVFKLGKKMDNMVDAFSATFMERFTGVIALGLISVVSLIKLLGLWGALLFFGFLVGVWISFYLLGFLSHKSAKLKKIYDSLNAYRGRKKIIFWAFFTSFIVQLLAIFTQYFVFLAPQRPRSFIKLTTDIKPSAITPVNLSMKVAENASTILSIFLPNLNTL